MQSDKKNVSKENIIETTLRLIEENAGIKDVNLRGIAKELGCAHTNIYNYFSSLDEVLWGALGQVMIKMIKYVDDNLNSEIDTEEKFYLFLSNIIDFSLVHPNWYRLVWMESIGGEPSPEVKKILPRPAQGFIAELIKASNNTLSEEKANLIGDILITYMHGELSRWINHRSTTNSAGEVKTKILSNLKYLYKSLISAEGFNNEKF